MRTLTNTLLLTATLTATAQAADVKVVQAPKGIHRDYPTMQLTTVYMNSYSLWMPPNGKTFIVTQACSFKGHVVLGGVMLTQFEFDSLGYGKTVCQTLDPGVVAPANEHIDCSANGCIITGWMR
jgi:hypothetical protein